ncbi:Retrotransposon Gag-Like Protein 9 [Manis pentadactyla]|nr:Retrotransposon Gag-Like Protein 9 [Manis pentadactyla]
MTTDTELSQTRADAQFLKRNVTVPWAPGSREDPAGGRYWFPPALTLLDPSLRASEVMGPKSTILMFPSSRSMNNRGAQAQVTLAVYMILSFDLSSARDGKEYPNHQAEDLRSASPDHVTHELKQ